MELHKREKKDGGLQSKWNKRGSWTSRSKHKRVIMEVYVGHLGNEQRLTERQKIWQIEDEFDPTPKLCYCHMPFYSSKPICTISEAVSHISILVSLYGVWFSSRLHTLTFLSEPTMRRAAHSLQWKNIKAGIVCQMIETLSVDDDGNDDDELWTGTKYEEMWSTEGM